MNIVIVTVDSLRADHVGCYGYDRDTTPNIDDLASEGTVVDAYANANATQASFPSIFTSTYPLAYGGVEFLSEERTPFAVPLQAASYETGGFHSNVWLSRDFGYDRGFDCFYDSKSEPGVLARIRTTLKTHLDHNSVIYRMLQSLYDYTEQEAGIDIGRTYKKANTITNRGMEFINDASKPFLCWVHYMDVHHPYVPRPNFAEKMGYDLDISEREAIQLRRKMLEHPDEVTDKERETLIDLYDAEIRYADHHIGRIIEAVEKDHPNTTVLFTSDHGEEFYEHGGYSHNPSMYDEVLHVPFIVSKKITGDTEVTAQLLDVAPTIHDIAGIPAPSNYEGQSVFTRIQEGDSAMVISETEKDDDLRLSVRTSDWKYIWDRAEGIEELYNLESDPSEAENCVEENPGPASEYRNILESHIQDITKTNQSLPDVAVDPETKRRLRELGYLD